MLTPVAARCHHVAGVTLRPLLSLLWVDLSTPLTGDEQADVSAAEHRKASRFRCAHDRRRYLAAHAALRRTLAACGAGEARSLHFRDNAWGKPGLQEPGDLHFNLSCSADIGLIGTSASRAIGVDVELMRPLPETAELVSEHFTLSERHEFECLPPEERDRAFLVGWTRKEACLKAIGVGLGAPPASVDVGLTGFSRRTRVIFGGRWYLLDLQSIAQGQDWVGAVAQVRCQGPTPTRKTSPSCPASQQRIPARSPPPAG